MELGYLIGSLYFALFQLVIDSTMESFVDYNSNLFGYNVQADEKMDREYQRSLITEEPLKPRVGFKFNSNQFLFLYRRLTLQQRPIYKGPSVKDLKI